MKLFKRFCALCLILAMLVAVVLPMNMTTLTASAIAGGGLQQTSYRAYGADLSFWNVTASLDYSLVDFAKMKADGCQFVILRLGYEGSSSRTNTLDTAFVEYYRRARAAGMPMGVYFYSLATTYNGAVEDANWVANKIEEYGMYFEYPIYYDVEDSNQTALGSSSMESLCLGWCETLEGRGYFPGVYGGGSQVINKLSSSFKSKYDLWYPRVLTDYDGGAQYNPQNYDYSDYCGMWQYAWYEYEYNGIGLNMLDVNVCYKDYPSIMAEYGYNNCVPAESAAEKALRQLIDTTWSIKYYEYSEEALEAIRLAVYEGNQLINNDASTDDQFTAATTKLQNAINNKPVILSLNKSYTATTPQRNDIFADDGVCLTNGAKGHTDGGNEDYAGWQKKLEVVVDLGSSVASDTYTTYLAAGMWGIHLPKKNFFNVEVYTSNSATSGFTAVGSSNTLVHTAGSNVEDSDWTTYTVTVKASAARTARYVKFVITNTECVGHIWVDEVEVSRGAPAVSGAVYVNSINTRVAAGECVIFNSLFGEVNVTTANHAWTKNIIAQYNSTYGGYVVTSISQGSGDSTPAVTLVSGQILIAVHAWEGEGVTDPVVGSGDNFNTASTVKVGDVITFSGLDINNGYVTAGSYVKFRGTAAVADDAPAYHYPGNAPTCTEGQSCTACGQTLQPALGHTEGQWETLADGSKVLKCSVCGEVIKTESANTGLKGDVNLDGVVDIFDYLIVKSICMDTYEAEDSGILDRSDVNGDNSIDIFDYLEIKSLCF